MARRRRTQEGVDERAFEWTTGRLSGGGSSINGEQYVRPTIAVLKEWEKLLGSMWSPEQAILKFKELENYNGKTHSPEIHGFNGRIDIRQTPKNPPNVTKKLVSAIEQATDLPKILDYKDPRTPIGPFNRWQLYQKPNGNRESSSTAFCLIMMGMPVFKNNISLSIMNMVAILRLNWRSCNI